MKENFEKLDKNMADMLIYKGDIDLIDTTRVDQLNEKQKSVLIENIQKDISESIEFINKSVSEKYQIP